MRLSRLATSISTAVVALALVGCGTTVPLTTTMTDGTSIDPQTGLAVAPDGTVIDPVTGEVVAADGAAVDPAAGGGTVVDPATGAQVPAAGATDAATNGKKKKGKGNQPSGAATTGPRVTKPIVLGIVGVDFSSLVESAGGDGGSDILSGFKAYVAAANKKGGLAGRRIVPVFHRVDGAGDRATGEQAACQDFTVDNKVEAVVGTFVGDSLTSCLAKAGVPYVVNDPIFDGDTTSMSAFGNIYNANATTVDRAAIAMFDQAVKEKWLTSSSKLGVLVSGCAWGTRTFDKYVAPRAKKAGISVSKYAVACQAASGTGELSAYSSAVASAILQFRGAGVDQVMFLNGTGDGPLYLLFATTAETQKYRPAYLVGSNAAAGAFIAGGLVNTAQATKTRGAGWMPVLDDPRSVTGLAKQCDAMIKSGGGPSAERAGQGGQICEPFEFLSSVMSLGNGSATQAAVSATVAGLGGRYKSTVTIDSLTSFTGSKHDGVSVTRPYAYVSGCKCFNYTAGASAIAGS